MQRVICIFTIETIYKTQHVGNITLNKLSKYEYIYIHHFQIFRYGKHSIFR